MLNTLINLRTQLISRCVIALLAGAVLPFAFAPIGAFILAFICPAILLSLWQQQTPQRAFYIGLAFGVGFFGLGVSWVYISIHQFGNTSIPLALIITSLFIAILALFPAAQGYCLARYLPRDTTAKFYLAFPASWALFEWMRSIFFTGFPWLLLGASQTHGFFKGYLPVVGEFGVTFLVTLCSALLVKIMQQRVRQQILRYGTLVLLMWLFGASLTAVHWTKISGVPFKVTLVQGNVPQALKWTPTFLDPTLTRYLQLTEPHWDSALIVWPEAAVPALLQNVPDFINRLKVTAAEHYTSVLLGIPVQENLRYYNSLLLLHDNGQQFYFKRHLVPFGEYVPLASWLRGLIGFFNIPMSDFSAGTAQQSLLQFNNLLIAPFICYEIAYQQEVLSALPQANLLVTVSNDAWFGHSFAAAQHLQIGQLRALETGRYHLFTANSGFTAIIEPTGTIQAALAADSTATLTDTVQPYKGATPLVWLGSNTILGILTLLLACGFRGQRRS